MKLNKSIVEIQNKIINYDRNSAIELIKKSDRRS
ncbi:unknown [Clostridium sp. CAG:921]|nr:unknown [Clostridium sp. CAG:921]